MHTLSLGIIGLGRIGGCLSDKCRYLFRRVMAVDPYIKDEEFIRHGAEKTDLDTLLRESHVISLHCNLNAETRNIIDMDAFQKTDLPSQDNYYRPLCLVFRNLHERAAETGC